MTITKVPGLSGLKEWRNYMSNIRNMEKYHNWRRKWRSEHPENQKQMNDRYYEKHKEEVKALTRKYRKRNPDKVKAHNSLNHSIEKGLIKRHPCILCGKKGNLHHNDYSKPYEGIWLCPTHHHQAHHGLITVLNGLKRRGQIFLSP